MPCRAQIWAWRWSGRNVWGPALCDLCLGRQAASICMASFRLSNNWSCGSVSALRSEATALHFLDDLAQAQPGILYLAPAPSPSAYPSRREPGPRSSPWVEPNQPTARDSGIRADSIRPASACRRRNAVRRISWTRRQSRASSSADNYPAVSRIKPSSTFGQRNSLVLKSLGQHEHTGPVPKDSSRIVVDRNATPFC